jgi:hypothetical protein
MLLDMVGHVSVFIIRGNAMGLVYRMAKDANAFGTLSVG